jgi:hypothetical protein
VSVKAKAPKPSTAVPSLDQFLDTLKRRKILWELHLGTVTPAVSVDISNIVPVANVPVLLDGDDTPIAAQGIVGPVFAGSRVVVVFVPPSGYYIMGYADPNAQGVSAPWTDYVPDLNGVTLGNGAFSGRFRRTGQTLDFRIQLSFGSSTVVTGNITFGIPFNAYDTHWTGPVLLYDSSVAANRQSGTATYATVTTMSLYAGTGGQVNATVPFAWAVSDLIRVSGTLELA